MKRRKDFETMKAVEVLKFWVLALLVLSPLAGAAVSPDPGTYMLPMNCSELLPDAAPYLNFFESVARATVAKDRKFSKRILRILALRDHFADSPDRSHELNPIDVLIRRTLCFYREQKEPTKPIGFDDQALIGFVRTSLPELEKKVKESILQSEMQRQQRLEYERKLRRNQGVVENLQREADEEADRAFDNLAKVARKKIRQ